MSVKHQRSRARNLLPLGATGVIYHAPFPVLARASWGFWGSYIAIISRAILAVFWFAIQTMNGANTVRVMLGAIWPSFLTLENRIPESQGITTNTMISFFLFWLAQIPFLYMHPNNLRWLFMAKTIIVPVAWIAILIWAFVAEGGGDLLAQRTTISGSAYSWVRFLPIFLFPKYHRVKMYRLGFPLSPQSSAITPPSQLIKPTSLVTPKSA